MYLIIGLGNPGRKYRRTKHNLGFLVIDELARELGLKSREFVRKFGVEAARAVYKRHRLILAKPQTFMNLSGAAVVSLLHYYKIPVSNLIVIHDDLDLEWGRLKIKTAGGTAGHKGLDSIVECLGSGDFLRVRLGIGRGQPGQEKEYVLEKFSAAAAGTLKEVLTRAVAAVLVLVDQGPAAAMNLYNS